jgi:hypothetical protein
MKDKLNLYLEIHYSDLNQQYEVEFFKRAVLVFMFLCVIIYLRAGEEHRIYFTFKLLWNIHERSKKFWNSWHLDKHPDR